MAVGERTQNQAPAAGGPAETTSPREAMPTIKDLRAFQPPRHSEGFLGLLYREASLPLSWLFVRTGASANQVTVLWITTGMIATGLLASGNYWWTLAGALCLQLVELLDRVDGDVARYRDRRTLYGKYLDLLGHTLLKSLLIVCVCLGVYANRPQLWVLLLGIAGALGLSVGSHLRFYRGYLLRISSIKFEQRSRPASRALRVLLKVENLWRTGGLFAVIFVGALANGMVYVLILYGITAPLWAATVSLRTSRELRVFDSTPRRFQPKDEGLGAYD